MRFFVSKKSKPIFLNVFKLVLKKREQGCMFSRIHGVKMIQKMINETQKFTVKCSLIIISSPLSISDIFRPIYLVKY